MKINPIKFKTYAGFNSNNATSVPLNFKGTDEFARQIQTYEEFEEMIGDIYKQKKEELKSQIANSNVKAFNEAEAAIAKNQDIKEIRSYAYKLIHEYVDGIKYRNSKDSLMDLEEFKEYLSTIADENSKKCEEFFYHETLIGENFFKRILEFIVDDIDTDKNGIAIKTDDKNLAKNIFESLPFYLSYIFNFQMLKL